MKFRQKFNEIWQELREFFFSREGVVDTVFPPIVFFLVLIWADYILAAAVSTVIAVVFGIIRIRAGRSIVYAILGVIGVAGSFVFSLVLHSSELFFVPGVVQSFLIAIAATITLIIHRPMVALTSHVARQWPLAWYRHPRVLPAYMEVTAFWIVYFLMEGLLGILLLNGGNKTWLGISRIVTGIPATVALLVVSYVYGLWRLRNLGGPSIEEFKKKKKKPWKGQQRGF